MVLTPPHLCITLATLRTVIHHSNKVEIVWLLDNKFCKLITLKFCDNCVAFIFKLLIYFFMGFTVPSYSRDLCPTDFVDKNLESRLKLVK